VQTENLIFYHGTGSDAAQAILGSRAKPQLKEIGAFKLGQDILRALRTHAKVTPDEDAKLHFVFKGRPGAEYSDLWLPAFKGLDSDDYRHFKYGHFFATLNIANAYRYALNPYRSEFLRAIAESIELLRDLGDPLPDTLPSKYPRIASAIESPSPPVVLELRGITAEKLLTAEGDSDIQGQIENWSDMQTYSGVNAPVDFRICYLVSGHIVAIHDLSSYTREMIGDGAWQPDESQLKAARHLPGDWAAMSTACLTPPSTSAPSLNPR